MRRGCRRGGRRRRGIGGDKEVGERRGRGKKVGNEGATGGGSGDEGKE